MTIRDRYNEVLEKIEEAKIKAGRKDEVKLIAVTKTVSNEAVEEVINAGAVAIGENRPQELVKRMSEFGSAVEYHMIGRLQTNKVRHIIKDVELVHSLDRMSLAKEIEARAKAIDKVQPCLLQVNISGEETKTGFSLEEVLFFVEDIAEMPYIIIKGLMTMAPFSGNEKEIRSIFEKLYKLKRHLEEKHYTHIDMKYLSMGMSQDYEYAILEGANMVRIGSNIFGKRE
ncbi:MAG: YggS family pyridoxal phosphate-dependent enzyme [Tissierellia bacterium]|nr:YggS family pyridoxal phosphate-dependent enzyme [Tissierellia bacterium]